MGGHFYFVRHGQTVWNVENKICGATDIELTELGHEQAIETGKKTGGGDSCRRDPLFATHPGIRDGKTYFRDHRHSHAYGNALKGAEFW